MPRTTPRNEQFINNGTIRLDQDSDGSLDQDTTKKDNTNFIDDGPPPRSEDDHDVELELYKQILQLDSEHRPIVQLYLPSHPNFSVSFVSTPASLMGELKRGRMGKANRRLVEEGLRLAFLDQEKKEKNNDLDRRILERQAEWDNQDQEAKRRRALNGIVDFNTPAAPNYYNSTYNNTYNSTYSQPPSQPFSNYAPPPQPFSNYAPPPQPTDQPQPTNQPYNNSYGQQPPQFTASTQPPPPPTNQPQPYNNSYRQQPPQFTASAPPSTN